MSYIFSDFFVTSKDLPQYTACVAVLLYKQLQDVIPAENVETNECYWDKNYYVPIDYERVTELEDGAKHCLVPRYSYVGFPKEDASPKDPIPCIKTWIENMCKVAICKNKSDPNIIHGRIIEYVDNNSKKIPPLILRNSTNVNYP